MGGGWYSQRLLCLNQTKVMVILLLGLWLLLGCDNEQPASYPKQTGQDNNFETSCMSFTFLDEIIRVPTTFRIQDRHQKV